MEDPKRPGVYIEEISLLPPSVAGVSTAVPAFLGYTRKFEKEPQKITSLLEFTTIFGEPFDEFFTATNEGDDEEPKWKIDRVENEQFWLYYLLKMFFNNGGRVCYVISINPDGNDGFPNAKSKDDFITGLKKLEKEDEPTLIILGEAATFGWIAYKEVLGEALAQCGRQKDRFAILDVQQGDETGEIFRDLASEYLRYGAAYTPFLKTSVSYKLTEGFEGRIAVNDGWVLNNTSSEGLHVRNSAAEGDFSVKIEKGGTFEPTSSEDDETATLSLNGVDGAKAKDIVADLKSKSIGSFEVYAVGDGAAVIGEFKEKDLTAIKALKVVEDVDATPLLLFTYTGDDAPKLNLRLGQDSLNFDYSNGTYVVDVMGKEMKVSDLVRLFQSKNKYPSFNLLQIGAGKINHEITDKSLEKYMALQVPSEGKGLVILYSGEKEKAKASAIAPELDFNIIDSTTFKDSRVLIIDGVGPGISPKSVVDQWKTKLTKDDTFDPEGFELSKLGDDPVTELEEVELVVPTVAELKNYYPEKYNQIKSKLDRLYLVLPPSGAMAGVYARVDQERGVWKAPANVGVMSVIGPDVKITDLQHDGLNYHPGPGKSINAIRNFTGRGTLVWGARTLDGNSNEWRYIPVRRLFNFIEESIQKATGNFVFEPNNATTWLKVKGMIESFLFDLWQKGALAGPTPEAAYFVHIGLGKTMTQNDILNGKMIVDVGVAAVRPAEFIMLRFSHKMQEAA